MTQLIIDLPKPIEDHYFGRVFRELPHLVSANEIEAKVCELILHDLESAKKPQPNLSCLGSYEDSSCLVPGCPIKVKCREYTHILATLGGGEPATAYKILESVPDKNGIVILGIKEDLSGAFVSRKKALEYLEHEQHLRAETKKVGRKQVLDWIKHNCVMKVTVNNLGYYCVSEVWLKQEMEALLQQVGSI